MLRIIASLLDRFMFTLTFIIGVQLPEFLQQYTQRLGGQLDEANRQLLKFQQIADNHYQGDLTAMVNNYRSNSDSAIVETGEAIFQLVERSGLLMGHLADVTNKDLWHQWYAFFFDCDIATVQATLRMFQLAIPLEPYALLFGLGVAITLLAIEKSVCKCCIYTYRKFTPDAPQFNP